MSARTAILFVGAFVLAQANHVALLILGGVLAACAAVSMLAESRRGR